MWVSCCSIHVYYTNILALGSARMFLWQMHTTSTCTYTLTFAYANWITHTCAYTYAYAYVYAYTHINACMYVCMYVCKYVRIYVYMYLSMHDVASKCRYRLHYFTRVYTFMFAYMFVYTYRLQLEKYIPWTVVQFWHIFTFVGHILDLQVVKIQWNPAPKITGVEKYVWIYIHLWYFSHGCAECSLSVYCVM